MTSREIQLSPLRDTSLSSSTNHAKAPLACPSAFLRNSNPRDHILHTHLTNSSRPRSHLTPRRCPSHWWCRPSPSLQIPQRTQRFNKQLHRSLANFQLCSCPSTLRLRHGNSWRAKATPINDHGTAFMWTSHALVY